jgi:hypothetical protein
LKITAKFFSLIDGIMPFSMDDIISHRAGPRHPPAGMVAEVKHYETLEFSNRLLSCSYGPVSPVRIRSSSDGGGSDQ